MQSLVWTLITGSIILMIAEFAVGPDSPWYEPLVQVDRTVLWLFVVEYVLRVVSYRPPGLDLFDRTRSGRLRYHVATRVAYCLRPLMVIDLATVLALAPQLRGLRALRLLRLLRVPKVFRYANPFMGVIASLRENRLMFAFGLMLLAATTILGGLSIYLIEGPFARGAGSIDSLGDGL